MALSSSPPTLRAVASVALVVALVIIHGSKVDAACQSCLLPFVAGGRGAHQHGPVPAANSLIFGAFATRQFLSVLDNRQHRFLASSDDSEALDEIVDDDAKSEETNKRGTEQKEVTAAMVASIGFYKKFISPLLPPACRFLPTCSQYGVQAIEQFGPTKGAILTAWRLLRCSPIGGRGYDPPKWPPVAYNYGSY
jgi:hypothetical protein